MRTFSNEKTIKWQPIQVIEMANINKIDRTDATFVVGNGRNKMEVNVIKVLLAINSEYFHTLFSNKHFKHSRKEINATSPSAHDRALKVPNPMTDCNKISVTAKQNLDGKSDHECDPTNDNEAMKTHSKYVYYEPDVRAEIFKFIVNYCDGVLSTDPSMINDKNIVDLLYASQKYLSNDLMQECWLFIK